MIGNHSYFSGLKECFSGHVTFGDGAKGRILAKGNMIKQDLPRLNDVRYVEGLTTNLISVSQPCNQGYTVNFSKEECIMSYHSNNILMKGIRQIDNCYH